MINRQTYALKPRGGMYQEMTKKCPMTDCNGKPKNMTGPYKRKYQCDKCEQTFVISYIPYLRRVDSRD
jgi:hypothetical protein